MKFVNYATYTQDAAKIAEFRPQHRAYLADLLAQGKIAVAGPLGSDAGAMIIYETDTLEQAQALADGDPFATGGVFVSVDIKPWKLVFSNPALLQVPA